MKNKTNLAIIFLILFFILILVACIYAHKWTKEVQRFLSTAGSVEYAKVNDVVITETKDGVKDWEIYAAIGEYDATREKATLTDIVGNYYRDDEVVMSFTSPKGFYDSQTKKIELFDDVKVVGKDNITLTANKLYWTTTEETIHAEGNVVVNKNDEIISLSNKGTASTDLTFFEIIDNAELRVYKVDDKGVLK